MGYSYHKNLSLADLHNPKTHRASHQPSGSDSLFSGWEDLSSQISAGNKVFTTGSNFVSTAIIVFGNRTLLIHNSDYTVTDDNEFTLSETMDYLTDIRVWYIK